MQEAQANNEGWGTWGEQPSPLESGASAATHHEAAAEIAIPGWLPTALSRSSSRVLLFLQLEAAVATRSKPTEEKGTFFTEETNPIIPCDDPAYLQGGIDNINGAHKV